MYIIDKIPLETMKANFETFCAKAGGEKVAGDGGVFVITNDGKPYAALMAIGEFEDYRAVSHLTAKPGSFQRSLTVMPLFAGACLLASIR